MSRFSCHAVLVCALILCLVPSSLARLAPGPVRASAASAPAAPWPQFRQDPTHQARSQAVGPRIPAPPLWQYHAGGSIYSSPAVGPDGTVYVGSSSHYLYALNPDGSVKWSYSLPASADNNPVVGTVTIGSSPQTVIYIASAGGVLNAIEDVGTPVLLWSNGFDPALGGDVTLSGGHLVVGTTTGNLYEFDAASGTLMRTFSVGSTIIDAPAVGPDGSVYFGSYNNTVYALSPTFTLEWSYNTGQPIESSPAIGANGTIYIGSNDFYLYALSAPSSGTAGVLDWRYHTNGAIESSPAIGSDGTIYVGSDDGNLYALTPSGTLDWAHYTGALVYSSPALDAAGAVYVGNYTGTLSALNAATGTVLWTYTNPTNNLFESSPAIGADGTVYIGSYDANLYAFSANPPPTATPTATATATATFSPTLSRTPTATATSTPTSTSTTPPSPTSTGTAVPAPVYVQGTSADPQASQSTVTVSYTHAQAAGDLNIVAVGWNDTTAAISAVVDSAGNTYQVAVPMGQTPGLRQAIYYAKNIGAATTNTVTVSFNQVAAYPDIRIMEYANVDKTNPFDVGSTGTGSAATATSGNATTTTAPELLVGAGMTVGGFNGAGSGYTNRMITNPDADIAEDQVATATGSHAATAAVSGAWLMQLAAFKAAAGSAPTATPSLTATPTPPAATSSATSTPLSTNTASKTPTLTAIPTLLTATSTNTPLPTITATRTPAATATPTLVPPPSPTSTATSTAPATSTPMPANTNTPVPANTNTPVPANTNTPVPNSGSVTNTPVPVNTNTSVPVNTNTPVPNSSNTNTPTTATPTSVIPSATATSTPTATAVPPPSPTATPTTLGCAVPPTVGSGLAVSPTSGALTDLFTVTIDPSVGVSWQGWFLKWDRQTILVAGQGSPVSNLEFVPPAVANTPGYHTVDLYQATLNGSTLVVGALAASVPYRISGGVCDPSPSPTGTPTMSVSQTL